jgi:hypothetical protein
MPIVCRAAPAPIRVEYVAPRNLAYEPLYELLQQRRPLEKMAEIFSPFRLPIELILKTVECEGQANAYYQRPEVRICYEYLDEIRHDLQGRVPRSRFCLQPTHCSAP